MGARHHVGPFSALLVLSPLFVARWAFVQYGDENNAHERTLRALVAAVETKDARTRGHSERVATLCDLIAGAMGMNHTDIASLRYAGMLHDVGFSAVPSRVLRQGLTASLRLSSTASVSTPHVAPTSCATSRFSLLHSTA